MNASGCSAGQQQKKRVVRMVRFEAEAGHSNQQHHVLMIDMTMSNIREEVISGGIWHSEEINALQVQNTMTLSPTPSDGDHHKNKQSCLWVLSRGIFLNLSENCYVKASAGANKCPNKMLYHKSREIDHTISQSVHSIYIIRVTMFHAVFLQAL